MNLLEIMKKNADNAKSYITNALTGKLDKTIYDTFTSGVTEDAIKALYKVDIANADTKSY